MELPAIDSADLIQFHALYDDFKLLQGRASAALELAKLNKDNEITIARDGQPVVVKEGDLWTEIWHLRGTYLHRIAGQCLRAGTRAKKRTDHCNCSAHWRS